jgi:hypothetical protein
VKKELAEHDFNTLDKRSFMSASEDKQDLSVGEMLVYFGAPNIFITLWFGFNYETNPPLGTLINNKFIFVCAFGSVMFLQENMHIKDGVQRSN